MRTIFAAFLPGRAEYHKLPLINDVVTFIIHKFIILLKVTHSVIIVGYPTEKTFRPEISITMNWCGGGGGEILLKYR